MPKHVFWTVSASLIGIGLFFAFYLFAGIRQLILLDFSGPSVWGPLYIVDDYIHIPLSTRMAHVALVSPAIVSTAVMLIASLRLGVLLLRGTPFLIIVWP